MIQFDFVEWVLGFSKKRVGIGQQAFLLQVFAPEEMTTLLLPVLLPDLLPGLLLDHLIDLQSSWQWLLYTPSSTLRGLKPSIV